MTIDPLELREHLPPAPAQLVPKIHAHRDIGRDSEMRHRCACGAEICWSDIPLRSGSVWRCILTKSHAGMCDNARIPAAQLYWRRQ